MLGVACCCFSTLCKYKTKTATLNNKNGSGVGLQTAVVDLFCVCFSFNLRQHQHGHHMIQKILQKTKTKTAACGYINVRGQGPYPWDAPATKIRTCKIRKKHFSQPERHFGSKLRFLVLGMKLPNSRSFAIIGKENIIGLGLEDSSSVDVWVYGSNGGEE